MHSFFIFISFLFRLHAAVATKATSTSFEERTRWKFIRLRQFSVSIQHFEWKLLPYFIAFIKRNTVQSTIDELKKK